MTIASIKCSRPESGSESDLSTDAKKYIERKILLQDNSIQHSVGALLTESPGIGGGTALINSMMADMLQKKYGVHS